MPFLWDSAASLLTARVPASTRVTTTNDGDQARRTPSTCRESDARMVVTHPTCVHLPGDDLIPRMGGTVADRDAQTELRRSIHLVDVRAFRWSARGAEGGRHPPRFLRFLDRRLDTAGHGRGSVTVREQSSDRDPRHRQPRCTVSPLSAPESWPAGARRPLRHHLRQQSVERGVRTCTVRRLATSPGLDRGLHAHRAVNGLKVKDPAREVQLPGTFVAREPTMDVPNSSSQVTCGGYS